MDTTAKGSLAIIWVNGCVFQGVVMRVTDEWISIQSEVGAEFVYIRQASIDAYTLKKGHLSEVMDQFN